MKRFYLFLLCFFVFATQAADLLTQPTVQAFITKAAHQSGYSKATLTQLFRKVSIHPKIIKIMNHPYESLTWPEYRKRFITKTKIQDGVLFWQQHKALLAKISKKYKVDPAILVATIGIESNYGKLTGSYKVIDSLSTLAFYYPRRASFFQKELMDFLILTKQYKINPLAVYGSYAGAIGQLQFMPSSVEQYAIDYDHNRPLNLSHDEADILASIANYYYQNGWEYHRPIMCKAKLTHAGQSNIQQYTGQHSYKLPWLAKHGVNPSEQISSPLKASIFSMTTQSGTQYWLGFQNFYVIMRYNPSHNYAMVVAELANAIKSKLN